MFAIKSSFDKTLIRNFCVFGPSFCTRNFKIYAKYFTKSHYEILNLKRNCSSSDIKKAFINLSKKYHPDINKNSNAHSQYTQIVEAYSVLGKPHSRRLYDIRFGSSAAYDDFNIYSSRKSSPRSYKYATRNRPRVDPIFWEGRNKTRDKFYQNQSYYGMKGIPKLSNKIIALACIAFTITGVCIQAYLINRASKFRKERIIMKTKEANAVLMNIREQSDLNGNTKQVELLKEKFQQNNKPIHHGDEILENCSIDIDFSEKV